MEFGRITPPNLYGLSVFPKAKQQYKDTVLGNTEKCPFKQLVELKHNSQFAGSIHSISIDPLIVHYWSTHQLVIYKDLCKSYTKISIDATGGLVKKRIPIFTTGKIYRYCSSYRSPLIASVKLNFHGYNIIRADTQMTHHTLVLQS